MRWMYIALLFVYPIRSAEKLLPASKLQEPKRFLLDESGVKTLELDYQSEGNQGQIRSMQFFRLKDGGISIEITDQFGIGSGTLRRLSGDWPQKIQFRLRLKGLEGMRMTIGKKVFSRDTLRIRLCDPKGKTLEGKHLQNRLGYYEVLIPPNALRGNKEVRLNWVDFYRR